jgi:hypothetical protein
LQGCGVHLPLNLSHFAVARLLFRQWRDLPGGLVEVLLNRDLPVHRDPAGDPTSNLPGDARPGGEATLAASAVTSGIPPVRPAPPRLTCWSSGAGSGIDPARRRVASH